MNFKQVCPALIVSILKLYPTMGELEQIRLDRICLIARARGFEGCEGCEENIK